MGCILGLDLAPRKCGWCAGDGATIPTAGGFRLLSGLNEFGPMLEEMRNHIEPLLDRWRPVLVVYESPILPSSGGPTAVGSTDQRRAQFSQGSFVEWLCLRRGVECIEADTYDVKLALTGSKKPGRDSQEQKDAMVAAALKVGIALPAQKVDGREDAADAAGAWKYGLQFVDKHASAEWDRRLFSSRGGLL